MLAEQAANGVTQYVILGVGVVGVDRGAGWQGVRRLRGGRAAGQVDGHLGSAHTGLVAQWNGSTWTKLTVPLPNNDNMLSDLGAVSADSASDVWIAGTYLFEVNCSDYSEEDYSLHWNGSASSIVPMPLNPRTNPNVGYAINALKANSPTDVWAVGDEYNLTTNCSSTLIEHYNGTDWSIVTSPSPGTGADLTDVTPATRPRTCGPSATTPRPARPWRRR